MTATDVYLIVLCLMGVVLGALIQKVVIIMANDPDISEDLDKIRKYIPKRRRVKTRWQ